MTEARSIDTPPIRHGTPSRRVFQDSSAIAWEAVAAWDQAPDGAFHTPRIVFRSLDDPEAPYLLGPAVRLEELNERELRSLLLRARPDETAEAATTPPEVTPEPPETTPEPPETTREPPAAEVAEQLPEATAEPGAAEETREEAPAAATTSEAGQVAAQPEEGAREPDELHFERRMAAPQPDASATEGRGTEPNHDHDVSRSDPVTDAASETKRGSDEAPEDPEIDAMGMAVGSPGEWLPPLDGDFDIVEGERGLAE